MIRHVHISETEFPGVLEIVASGWDGRILKMTRDAYFKLRQRAEGLPIQTAATYILYGSYFDRSDEEHRRLYVGKTKDAKQRGDAHEREKDFWTDALVFSSSGPWMNSAHAGSLEHQFIEWVRDANRYTVTNGSDGGDEPLGPCDAAILDLFKRDVRSVSRMAGIDVFEPDPFGLFFYDWQASYRGAHRFNAKARREGGALLVLAGSTLPAPNEETGYEFLQVLEQEGRITREESVVRVLADARIPLVGVTQKILGTHPHQWLTVNRRKLSSALRAKPSDEDMEPAPDGDVASK